VLGSEMKKHNLNIKKNSFKVTAATLFTLAFFVVVTASVAAATVITGGINQSADAQGFEFVKHRSETPKAPSVVTGDNIYVAWWTNNTENGNEEVMFRASNDGGATFGDKINLSNTTDADSTRVEIAGEDATVIVSWWETNQTSDIPVARISEDGGETFGPMLRLATNGTISSTEEEQGGEGEIVEEEAVGGAEVAE
jgi:hypothetical protein